MGFQGDRRGIGVFTGLFVGLLVVGCSGGAQENISPSNGEPGARNDTQTPSTSDSSGTEEAVVGEIDQGLRDMFAEGKADAPVAVRETPTILSSADLESADVAEHEIRFGKPSAAVRGLQGGTLVASSDEARYFLRRIESIAYDPAGAKVEDASFITIKTSDVTLGEVAPELTASKSFELPKLENNVSGQVFFEGQGGKVTCSDCYVRLSPKVGFGFKLSGGGLDSFLGSIEGNLEGKVKVTAELERSIQVSKEIEFAAINQHFVQMVGPVPIWEDVSVKVVGGISGKLDGEASVSTGIHASKQIKVEFGRKSGKWVFNSSGSQDFGFEKIDVQTDISTNAKFYLKTRVEFKLYSVVKTWVDTEARGDIDLKVCPAPASWTGKGHLMLKAGAGLDLRLFTRSGEVTLLDKEFPGSGAIPGQIPCGR